MQINFSYSLKKALKEGYGLNDFKSDLVAASVVSLISVPLSMALAIVVGLDPQYGIYTAIIAGIIASLLGGSNTQVSGPTGAFVVILAPIVIEFGIRGLIIAQAMAGIIIILMAIFKLGKYIKYIPHAVTVGFTTGIALVLIVISLKDLLGMGNITLTGNLIHKLKTLFQNSDHINLTNTFIGIITIILIKSYDLMPKKGNMKYLPSVIISVFIVSIISYFLNKYNFGIKTLESEFFHLKDNIKISGIPGELPKFNFFNSDKNSIYYYPTMKEVMKLLPSAITIAILASLESLLSAVMADEMSGYKHNSNSEILGIGVANVVCAFANGMPATGALARTAANVKNGAKTPFAAFYAALLILTYVLVLKDFINKIPTSALSAILFLTAWRMADIKEFNHIISSKVKTNSIVLISTFLLTAIFDMIIGVSTGLLMHLIFLWFNKKQANN